MGAKGWQKKPVPRIEPWTFGIEYLTYRQLGLHLSRFASRHYTEAASEELGPRIKGWVTLGSLQMGITYPQRSSAYLQNLTPSRCHSPMRDHAPMGHRC